MSRDSTNAAYDQFDAGVRENWKKLTPEEKIDLRNIVVALRNKLAPDGIKNVSKFAALLLVWATCTMTKRDSEEAQE